MYRNRPQLPREEIGMSPRFNHAEGYSFQNMPSRSSNEKMPPPFTRQNTPDGYSFQNIPSRSANQNLSPRVSKQNTPRSSIQNHYSPNIPPSSLANLTHSFGSYDERPNQVVSASRKFNTGFYPKSIMGQPLDSQANQIVAELEENKQLMEDTPISEELRKEALRELPQGLTMKRCVRHKLSKSVSQRSRHRPIGFFKAMKYRASISWTQFVGSVQNFNYFQLWHGSLKDVESRFGSGYASYFKFLRWLFVMTVVIALFSLCLIVVPQVVFDASVGGAPAGSFQAANIFVGDGLFAESVLYYGHYTHTNMSLISSLAFHMPSAYFGVTMFFYVAALLIFALSVAQSYRRSFIETEGGFQHVYAHKIFCGWDFAIATQEASKLRSLAIYNELNELLAEEGKEDENMSCMNKFMTLAIKVVVNIIALMFLAAIGWLIWLLLDREIGTGHAYEPAIVANVSIMIFPSLFNYVSKYEGYKSPRTALYITLIRTYLLGAVLIGVILSFWLVNFNRDECWEDALASEIYRFTIFDFLFSVVLSAIFDVAYYLAFYFSSRNPKTEFNIAKHTLLLIYNQGLFWVGFFYSPILPIIVALKMFLIWYIRLVCVRYFCVPPKRTWRAAQAQTVFMMMTFVSILIIIGAHLYTMDSVPCSHQCGPFKAFNHTYEIVTDNIRDLDKSEVGAVFMSVTKPGGVALIMLGILMWIYYSKQQAVAGKEQVRMLRENLVWLAKDKRYITQWYNYLKRKEGEKDRPNLSHDSAKDRGDTNYCDDELSARFSAYQ